MEKSVTPSELVKSAVRTRQQENNDKNFTPRTYQVVLLEKAKERNTIVCLQTGVGKTFIAAMLIRDMAHKLRKPYKEEGKRAIFLVPTVPLVSQQASVIATQADLKVGEYIGAKGVDLWKKDRWEKEFVDHHVLVMTAQIFLDILNHGFMPVSKVKLLIFDECHHAVKSHPYRQIMKTFDQCPPEKQPRVLGLTASILNERCKPQELETKLNKLEVALRASAETVTDELVAQYNNQAQEKVIYCQPLSDVDGVATGMLEVLEKAMDDLDDLEGLKLSTNSREAERDPIKQGDPIKQSRQALVECFEITRSLGPWAGHHASQMLLRQLAKLVEQEHCPRHQRFYHLAATQLRLAGKLYQDCCGQRLDLRFVSHKVIRMVEELKRYRPQPHPPVEVPGMGRCGVNSGSRAGPPKPPATELYGLVFVERRDTARVLHKLVREMAKVDPSLDFLATSFITGHSENQAVVKKVPANTTDSEHRKPEEVLKKFRKHETNLLIATSVLEEGLDVPKCNLVVRFDLPNSYRSYMQSCGRARAPNSHYILMPLTTQRGKFQEDLENFKEINKILLKKCLGREAHSEEEIDFHMTADDIMPPYMPIKEDGKPRVTATFAISLINKYCAKLPKDIFTHLTPDCKIKLVPDTDPQQYIGVLSLPINSPLREEIQGPPMTRKKHAEMAVALLACQKLHEIGELNEHLLPISKDAVPKENEELEYEVTPEGEPSPGTNKRRQQYAKESAECLARCLPLANQDCWLYVIAMTLVSPLPDALNKRGRKVHTPEDTPQCFGFLTSNPIHQIPNYPIYTRSGEVQISMKHCATGIRLSESDISQIKDFHQLVFSEVLRLKKKEMSWAPSRATAQYYILPLTKQGGVDHAEGDYSIDYDFLRTISSLEGHLDDQISLRSGSAPFTFDRASFEDAVVAPSYRDQDHPSRYYVAEICTDHSPRTEFPSSEYDTFEAYFRVRYDLAVTTHDQPLLDVDHMSARLNLLTPRHLNHKGKVLPLTSKQTKRTRRENMHCKQFLVPEFCHIYPIPGSLWRKAICLPSILYRLNHLLLAQELRHSVARDVGVGKTDHSQFPDLKFDWNDCDQEYLSRREKLGGCWESMESLPEAKNGGANFTIDNWSGYPEASSVATAAGGDGVRDFLVLSSNSDFLSSDEEDFLMNDTTEFLGEDALISDLNKLSVDAQSKISAKRVPPKDRDGYCNGEEEEEFALDEGDKIPWITAASSDASELEVPVGGEDPSSGGNEAAAATETEVPSIATVDDDQLEACPGPSPTQILQALTMSNASDGFNLERLEMLGDSFLKQAITAFLFCTHPLLHEGKLSYMRSRQVSNRNLYHLGKRIRLPYKMAATLFDPENNWLPPGYVVEEDPGPPAGRDSIIPYNMHAIHSLSDKGVADCVEALIGCYLISCGFRGTLLFMSWLGLSVLPRLDGAGGQAPCNNTAFAQMAHSTELEDSGEAPPEPAPQAGGSFQYGHLQCSTAPLFEHVEDAETKLNRLLTDQLDADLFEKRIGYTFRDKAYLLQAFTHASYYHNKVTDCYQRLEFLGDAVLDYVITKHLYDHHCHHSPGILTDIRSALVNNIFFASLAVKYQFHKHFLYLAPELFYVIQKFVEYQEKEGKEQGLDSQLRSGTRITSEDNESEEEEEEDIEVPKALGDIFESVAGAIFMDSGMSTDAVWRVYYPMMKQQIDNFSTNVPISPVRELLEMEPETAKFSRPVKTLDGKTRVTASIVGKGDFKGIGRNYKTAKNAAARKALRKLKSKTVWNPNAVSQS